MDAADLASDGPARTIVDLSDDRGAMPAADRCDGAGDVVTALRPRATDLDDATSLDQSVAAMRDLDMSVADWSRSPPASAGARRSSCKRSAPRRWSIQAQRREHRRDGLGQRCRHSVPRRLRSVLTRTGPAPRGGLVDRLYGVTDPGAPILVTAAAQVEGGGRPQAPLAHAVVRETLDSGAFVVVFGAADVIAGVMPAERAYQDALGDVLAASVDHTLPGDDRAALSYDLTTTYVDVRSTPVIDTDGAFSPTVTRGLAAATQPLLERWMMTVTANRPRVRRRDALSVGDAVLDQASGTSPTRSGDRGLEGALRERSLPARRLPRPGDALS